MLAPSSLGSIALILQILCGAALSNRIPVNEIFRKELQKRLVCVEDDVLLSFQQYTDDSVPFCSTYLSIPLSTSTVSITARTTVTTTTTTTTGVDVVAITVPTATETVTAPAALDRRQLVTPASVVIASCTLSPQNSSLISSFSSACSCLTVTPSVTDQTSTLTSTRTITAINYQEGTTSSTASVEVTTTIRLPSSGVSGATAPASSGIALSTTSVSLFPSTTSTVPSLSSSGELQSSLSASVVSSATAVSSSPPLITINSTTPASSPSISTSTFSSVSSAASLTSASNTPGSSNSTSSTANTSPVVPATGLKPVLTLSLSTSVVSTGANNSITPTSGPFSGASTGLPISSSGPSVASTNLTFPSLTSVPAPLPSLGGLCPFENGTQYTTHGQTFLIYCYINYPGPSTQGLDVPDLYACIQDCAQVNLGFSQNNCWAASYNPNTLDRENCFFRDRESSQHPFTDLQTISAVLISGLPNVTTNSTSGVSPTSNPTGSISMSMNSTVSPSLIPSVNITSIPLSVLTGISSVPSGFITVSSNNTAISSPPGIPTSSSNVSTPVSPSTSINASSSQSLVIPVASENKTSGISTSTTSIFSTPTITTNASSAPSGLSTSSSNFTSFFTSCATCSHTTLATSFITTVWTTTIVDVETSTSSIVLTRYYQKDLALRPGATKTPSQKGQ